MKPTIIKPPKKFFSFNFKELLEFKDLFYILCLRDIKLRYKQTAIGVIWIVLQPLTTVGIFTIIFGKLAKFPDEGVPYAFFSFAAILPWYLFSQSVNRSCSSLVSQQSLITKVYFPRILIPLACFASTLLDFFISFVFMFFLLLIFKVHISINILFLPIIMIIVAMLSIGWSLIFAGSNVYYRDFTYILPFLMQVWTYVSPIGYSSTLIPKNFKMLYSLNPIVGIAEGFRWAFFGTQKFPFFSLSISFIVSAGCFMFGIFLFKKIETHFADII